jgi:hypothetical protein
MKLNENNGSLIYSPHSKSMHVPDASLQPLRTFYHVHCLTSDVAGHTRFITVMVYMQEQSICMSVA